MNQRNAKGQRHDEWEIYHDNGQLHWKVNYLNGKLHGPYESYFSNSNLSRKGLYQNEQKVGFWLDGYSDGKIRKLFFL